MALSPCVPMFWSARWGAPGLELSRRDTVEAGTKMSATSTSVLRGLVSRGNSAAAALKGSQGQSMFLTGTQRLSDTPGQGNMPGDHRSSRR